MTLLEINDGLQRGEFHTYYQPIVDAYTKQLCGYESLIRWHRNNDIVSANNFINIVSPHYAIMKKITSCVIYDVMIDFCSSSKALFPGQSININVSISLLLDNDISRDICFLEQSLRRIGLKLIIEITEYENIHNFPQAASRFEMYRANGITFAIDDFKGRSEDFDLLKISRAKITKIDKSILSHANSYQGQMKMKKIIEILKDMEQIVVAEGVESEHEEILLACTDVNLLQGFRYGYPLPYQELKTHWF